MLSGMDDLRPTVFVSCGQFTAAEKQLGRDICALLEELRPDVKPYFAETVSSVRALSAGILQALHQSAGFICVMHHRGEIHTPSGGTIKRGSVWIEQEIAIAAFMQHALGRELPVLFYRQKGVSLEGVRSVLSMNARLKFTHESEILDDLSKVLPNAAFAPFLDYDLTPRIDWRIVNKTPERHAYELSADVENTGHQSVERFSLRIFFPRQFLSGNTTWGAEEKGLSTEDHVCFICDQKRARDEILYPGDRLLNPLTVPYFFNSPLHRSPAAMASTIKVELFSGSMPTKIQEIGIKNVNKF